MKDAGHRSAVEAAFKYETPDRTPVNNYALGTSARSAGVTLDKARWDPKISAKVSIDYAMKTHSDFVKPVLDSQIPFLDMGMDVKFPDDDYGSVKSIMVHKPEDIDDLAFFDPSVAKECPNFTKVFVDGLNETAKQLPEDLHICGLGWGPMTTAGYLMGVEEMMMQLFMEPDNVTKLIAKTIPFVSDLQNAMVDSGATVMWMADPTSSTDLISPDMFATYSKDPIAASIKNVKDKHRGTPAFLHICGQTGALIPMLPETGTDCYSFDQAVDLKEARNNMKGKMALMGNIDPITMILFGTPEMVTEHCYSMIETAGLDGGYIIAPGCEAPVASPDATVIAMGLAGRSYWENKK